MKSLTEEMIFQ